MQEQRADSSVTMIYKTLHILADKFEQYLSNKFKLEEKITVLAEKYLFHFQLWKNYFNGKSLIIDRLPFPDPSSDGNFYHDDENNYTSILLTNKFNLCKQ